MKLVILLDKNEVAPLDLELRADAIMRKIRNSSPKRAVYRVEKNRAGAPGGEVAVEGLEQ